MSVSCVKSFIILSCVTSEHRQEEKLLKNGHFGTLSHPHLKMKISLIFLKEIIAGVPFTLR